MASGKGSTRRLEFKLSIGFVHPGGFLLGWFMGQMMERVFPHFGCHNKKNPPPPVPTIHPVVDRPRILHSCWRVVTAPLGAPCLQHTVPRTASKLRQERHVCEPIRRLAMFRCSFPCRSYGAWRRSMTAWL